MKRVLTVTVSGPEKSGKSGLIAEIQYHLPFLVGGKVGRKTAFRGVPVIFKEVCNSKTLLPRGKTTARTR